MFLSILRDTLGIVFGFCTASLGYHLQTINPTYCLPYFILFSSFVFIVWRLISLSDTIHARRKIQNAQEEKTATSAEENLPMFCNPYAYLKKISKRTV